MHNEHMKRYKVINTNRFSLTVSDNDILDVQTLLASTAGIFAELSAAATVAGLQKMKREQLFNGDERIVLIIRVCRKLGALTPPFSECNYQDINVVFVL